MAGKYTLITGASSGMGEATAKLLSKDRNLILHGRNEERLKAVGQACAEHGHEIALFPFDLEKADEVAGALKTFLKERELEVEAFAHFAGMTEVLPVSKTTYKIGLQVMNVNYFSVVEIISTLLKRKVNGDSLNRILLISSVVANVGIKYQPHYCASKSALQGLTFGLAQELAPQVRVNTIAPGSFQTRIWETPLANISSDAPWAPPTLLPPGTVDDIANVARFFLSEDAKYLTGQILTVDGGEAFPK